MIVDRREHFVIASLGWVEKGGFVRRNIQTGAIVRYPADHAAYVRLHSIDGDRFLVAGFDPENDTFSLSVRRFDSPDTVLWHLHVTPKHQQTAGDPLATAGMRLHHLVTFKNGGRWDHHLVVVAPDAKGANLGAIPWYNADNYDLGYQGLTDCVAIPGTTNVLVSVQRSSTVIVHDPVAGRDVGRFDLAGRNGNPILHVVGGELWTIDYDTFVRVDITTQRVMASQQVQQAAQDSGLTMQFAGDLFVWSSRGRAAIPRPFSSDVAIVNPDNGEIEATVPLKGQPIESIVTHAGRIIARNWKSGEWTEGTTLINSRRWWQVW